jgi:hypothetical protein
MLKWPLLDRLGDLYSAAGIKMPDTLRFELLKCADDGAAEKLERADDDAAEKLLDVLIEITCKQEGQARTPMGLQRALRSFEQVLGALRDYRALPFFHLRCPSDLLTKLDKALDQDLATVLKKLLSNPDNISGLLAELWRGATREGIVRERRCEDGLVIELKIRSDWIETGASEVAWAHTLAREPKAFRRMVRSAIKSRPVERKRLDLDRRLRDLARSPTARKLRKLLEDAREHDVNGLDVLGSALSFAGRETGLFPEGLPRDFEHQLASRPADIALLASAALELLKSGRRGKGRLRDEAFEQYADQLAAIYADLANKPIAYAKGSDNARPELRGRAYGSGLDFMHRSLQLLDKSVTDSCAQGQINRIRNWVKS